MNRNIDHKNSPWGKCFHWAEWTSHNSFPLQSGTNHGCTEPTTSASWCPRRVSGWTNPQGKEHPAPPAPISRCRRGTTGEFTFRRKYSATRYSWVRSYFSSMQSTSTPTSSQSILIGLFKKPKPYLPEMVRIVSRCSARNVGFCRKMGVLSGNSWLWNRTNWDKRCSLFWLSEDFLCFGEHK